MWARVPVRQERARLEQRAQPERARLAEALEPLGLELAWEPEPWVLALEPWVLLEPEPQMIRR